MYVSLDKKTPFPFNFGEPFLYFRGALGADRAPFGKDNEAPHGFCCFLMLVAELELAMNIFSCAVQTVASLIHPCLNLLKNLLWM